MALARLWLSLQTLKGKVQVRVHDVHKTALRICRLLQTLKSKEQVRVHSTYAKAQMHNAEK